MEISRRDSRAELRGLSISISNPSPPSVITAAGHCAHRARGRRAAAHQVVLRSKKFEPGFRWMKLRWGGSADVKDERGC